MSAQLADADRTARFELTRMNSGQRDTEATRVRQEVLQVGVLSPPLQRKELQVTQP